MNKLLYQITAWVLIIAGIVSAGLTIFSNLNAPLYDLSFLVLFAVLILAVSILPGRFFLRLAEDESQQNKLTNSSIILILVGIGLILISFIAMLFQCNIFTESCDGLIFIIVIWGSIPAAFLFAIAIILLLVNKYKK